MSILEIIATGLIIFVAWSIASLIYVAKHGGISGLGNCPWCGAPLKRHKDPSYGEFVGCSKFPRCTYKYNIQHAKR